MNAIRRNEVTALLSVVTITWIFCYLVIQVAVASKFHLLFYAILFPVVVILAFGVKKGTRRLYELIFIEGSFLVAIGALISYREYFSQHIDVNLTTELAYYCFVSVQGLGFIAFSLKNKRYIGIINTVLAMTIIYSYIAGHGENSLKFESDDVILPLGQNETLVVVFAYCAWFLCVVMNSARFPNLTQLVVHSTSVVFSAFSGSFLLYRILTAWSLFVLDLVFSYCDQVFFRGGLVMSDGFYEKHWEKIRTAAESISLILLIIITFYYFSRSLVIF